MEEWVTRTSAKQRGARAGGAVASVAGARRRAYHAAAADWACVARGRPGGTVLARRAFWVDAQSSCKVRTRMTVGHRQWARVRTLAGSTRHAKVASTALCGPLAPPLDGQNKYQRRPCVSAARPYGCKRGSEDQEQTQAGTGRRPPPGHSHCQTDTACTTWRPPS
jgi:hypothetical protein